MGVGGGHGGGGGGGGGGGSGGSGRVVTETAGGGEVRLGPGWVTRVFPGHVATHSPQQRYLDASRNRGAL